MRRLPEPMAWVVAAATVAFVASPLLTPGFRGFESGQFPVPQVDPMVQPSGYAFSIWGVIYAWLLISAVFGLIWRGNAPDWLAMRPALAASVGVGAAWLPVAEVAPLPATVLIWIMLGTALVALRRAPLLDIGWARAPLGLYAGWLTAASCVALGIVLAGYGLTSEREAAIVALLLALVIAIFVLRRTGSSPAYGIAVVWALIGVAVSNWGGNPAVFWLAAIGALVIAVPTLWRLTG
ncbi:hypothetical protein [Phaeobacter sp. 22II1-1F12B]|uniref:hypothetical protein n=1 Tax=Phaeobacter sp. 22II1-1F12B TaxID=1317111 RepID=UPI000B522849|nr:hypothetical protein [Phaeobacter sp. 22II1-1F12B]OWU81546.1 seryl-tRNA synthetase [Phaeobacter sp. 22II1-1F12B]